MIPTSRYKALSRITELWSVKTLHIVLPKDYVMLSDFHPRRPSHIPKLSFVLIAGSFGGKELELLAEAFKTNSTLATVDLRQNSIGSEGAQSLAEALKTNFTLTTLYLGNNSRNDPYPRVQNLSEQGVGACTKLLRILLSFTTLQTFFLPAHLKVIRSKYKTECIVTFAFTRFTQLSSFIADFIPSAVKSCSHVPFSPSWLS